jgi:hypothetical protein
MHLDQDEVQIVRGVDFIVTDKRIMLKSGEIKIATISTPQIEEREISASARVTVMAVGGVLLAGGLLAQIPLIWIIGALTCAFAPLANVKRRGLALTVETGGERRVIYEAANQRDANLALAAIEEALRRSAA